MNAEFLDPLDLRVVDDSGERPTYEVLANCTFYSAQQGREFTIPRGMKTDGPSIPVIGAALVGGGQLGLRAGVLHDAMWRDPAITTQVCNAVFYEALTLACRVDQAAAANMKIAVDIYATFGGRDAAPPEPPIAGNPEPWSNA